MPSWSKRSTDQVTNKATNQATKAKAKDQAKAKAKDQATLNLPERSYALPQTHRLKKKDLRKCPPQAQASIQDCPKELEEEGVSTPPPGALWQLE